MGLGLGLGEYTCGKWVQTFIQMYFVHNIHRLPAGNREGWEGWEGRGGVGVGGVHLLEIGRVARVGRVVLIVGAFRWKMGSNLLILCTILPATPGSRDDGCMQWCSQGGARGAIAPPFFQNSVIKTFVIDVR